MDTGADLSLEEFNSQTPGDEYGQELITFEQSKEQEPSVNHTIEMVDQSIEAGIEALHNGDSIGGDPELVVPHIGMEFDSLESARLFYFKYADCMGFRVRSSRFRTSRRDDSIIMRRFVCFKEGFYLKRDKKNATKERRKRGSLREGCKAMFEVIRKDQDIWVVAKLITEHTHPLSNAIKAHKPKKKKPMPSIPPQVGILFDQGQCHGIRRCNFWWGGGEAFNLLEYFKKEQMKNPAFFYAILVDESTTAIRNVFWADARARIAYSHFGDTVTLDTTYKKNTCMLPFVSFTGTNHHLHPVVFACAVISSETEDSFIWLFETFLTAMCRRHPASIVTEQTEALGTAVARVFPYTRHRYCKWWILSKCREMLPNICSTRERRHIFKGELRKCIDESESIENFESGWDVMLQNYNLRDNTWLQSLYEVRQQWATVYLKDNFFAEMSPAQRSESMHKFFQRNFETKTTIREFIEKFDQAMMGQYEKEVQADLAIMYTRPILITGLQIEQQAAEMYTKTMFSIFQEEFVQSSSYSYSVDKCEDGVNWTYHVLLDNQDAGKAFTVICNYPDKNVSCSCCKFEFSGILCRHALRVFSALQVCTLPENYILKRWRQTAKSGPVLFGSSEDFQSSRHRSFNLRCNDLFLDVLKYAEEGATSFVIHNAAKDALQKAFAEILAAKKQRSG